MADWQTSLAAHRQAVAAFIQTAAAVAPDNWQTPLAGDPWTPAEITTHLTLVYTTLLADLAGGEGFRPVVPGLARLVLRWTVLPAIFRSGRLPAGSRAPREIRPTNPAPDRDAALAELHAQSEAFLSAIATQPARRLNHPYFGRFTARRAIPFVTIHLQDHLRQLESINR